MTLPDFSYIKTHVLRGKVFIMKWTRPPGKPRNKNGDVGHCDHPDTVGKRIHVWPDPWDNLETVGTAAHELAHGAWPDLSEDAVMEYEESFIRLLKRMGCEVIFHGKGWKPNERKD